MRLALIIIATLAIGLVPALAGAATSSAGSADIAKAEALSVRWGRCPTARPAQAVLARAKRTRAPVRRARRARSAVRAWTTVATVCSRPVDQPTVIVP